MMDIAAMIGRWWPKTHLACTVAGAPYATNLSCWLLPPSQHLLLCLRLRLLHPPPC
jgi:hypothetical protein